MDRRALPEPAWAEPAWGEAGGERVAPRTPLEELIAGAWEEVLGADSVGAFDDFFALGGHSLLATRVASRLRRLLGVELPLRTLFERPTVAGLAAFVEEERGKLGQGLPSIERAARDQPLPLSFAQERLWFLDQLQPGSAAYNVVGGLWLAGALDCRALLEAFRQVADRHEALRSVFREEAGRPVQVLASGGPDLALIDLASMREGREIARALAEREARLPFDLQHGPLLRVRLVQSGEQEHLLVVGMHHIASDGWSVEVLLREVAEIYGGDQQALPELPIQYGDFAVWQRQVFAGDWHADLLAFWRERLQGWPDVLELPADRPRPLAGTHRGEQTAFALSDELVGQLRRLGRAQGATLFMVLLAGFEAVLARHAGKGSFLLGTPIANRGRAETEGLIGFFVNTLVLRAEVRGDESFEALLGRVREEALAAYGRQDLAFEHLVEALAPERDLSRNPLVQTMFALQNASRWQVPGLETERLDLSNGAAKLDLLWSLVEEDGHVRGWVERSADLFDASTVARLWGHWQSWLTAAVESPGARLDSLPLLAPPERHQLLAEWAQGDGLASTDLCLHHLFERQAALVPERIAISFEDRALSYVALDAWASRLARRLRRLGVGPEARVAVAAERSLELVVALYAVEKAGGAYVPLDPAYPAERLEHMLADAGVTAVLSPPDLWASLGLATAAPLVPLLPDGQGLEDEPAAPAPHVEAVTPEGLAYVIYTSGSTGRPKGAMNSHRGIVNRLLWMQEEYGLGAHDRVLQKTPASFDVSVWEFFWPLAVGARLVLARPGGQGDPRYLADLIERERITTLHFVPSMLAAFVDELQPGRLGSLSRVMASGEALPRELVRRFHSGLGSPSARDPEGRGSQVGAATSGREGLGRGAQAARQGARAPQPETLPPARGEGGGGGRAVGLHNLYGPTEAAVDVTYRPCPPGEEGPVPIGRPIANLAIRILDRRGRALPAGVPGELLIGGVGLGRGYLRRPGLTADRWVPDGVSGEPGARLYRTGDLARALPSGEIEYLGRLDFQVKLRGFRIELGEIESALLATPGVREAAVALRTGPAGPALAAYLVLDAISGDAEAVAADLRRRLPEPMVPSRFVVLAALPLTPSGKVDRRALPEPAWAEPAWGEAGGERVAPRTPLEELIAGAWEEVLGADSVGAFDDFFALGGHSLLATRVASRLRRLLGVELPLRTLFERPTVAGLAAFVEEERGKLGQGLPSIERAARNEPLPLSFAQERLWFLDQLQPGSAAYNVVGGLWLAGALDRRALLEAFHHVAGRHEALRSVFREHAGRPAQVLASGGPDLALIDLASMREGREIARSLAERKARLPFDLQHGPLLRVRLVQSGEQEHLLVVAMHHIASDGWSVEVLLREVAEIYGGDQQALPELPIQYGDFAVWQRQVFAGDWHADLLAFWRERLQGWPDVLELPADRPRPLSGTHRGEQTAFALSDELVGQLRRLGRAQGATLFMVLLAGFEAVLARHAGKGSFLLGTPIANRGRAETEGLIGFFVNTLVLRAEVRGDESFEALLGRVREEALAAYGRQDLAFEHLVEALAPERDLSRNPLVQTMFALQNASRWQVPGLETERLELSNGAAKLDLLWSLVEEDGHVRGWVERSADLFDASTVARLWGHWQSWLAAAVESPGASLDSLPLLAPPERHQLLAEWAQGDGLASTDLCLHQLFERQAALVPERIAISGSGEQWSYAHLDTRAGAWAGRLRALDLAPEARVGVMLDRRPELPAALLGVLRAGAAYVPLDPAYPAERLALLVEDSGLAAVLTEEHHEARLPSGAYQLLSAALPSEEGAMPAAHVRPEQLAYVIYTSGSTGRPKGVALTHRSAVARMDWAGADLSTAELGGLAATTSINFDLSVFELFAPLSHGGRIVLAADALALPGLDEAAAVTLLNTVPSAMASLAEGALPDTLTTVCLAGEPLRPELAAEIHRHPQVRRLLNLYGPTEDTTYSTGDRVERGERRVTIGRSLPGSEGLVLGRDGRPSPTGVPGQLFLGGVGLARGYLGRPGLTAERFVPHPLAAAPGARLYATGDLVRRLPDGRLDFLGRIDFQVKLRGFRIELPEIEARLAEHAAVREAAVALRQDLPGGPALVAYWSPSAEGPTLHAGVLRDHLAVLLPAYMVPAFFLRLDALPRTPNGKLDRKALPRPETDGAAGERAPRTPAEELVAGLFADLLGRPEVSAEAHFFELGGHSLLAARLVSRLRQAFGVELPLAAVFERPTVAGLAAAVEAGLNTGGQHLPPIERAPHEESLPLSFAQERLWFLDQLHPGDTSYNVPAAVRLAGSLAPRALATALAGAVERHDALRTVFRAVDGEPVAVVQPPPAPDLPVIDLSPLGADDRGAETVRLARREAARPFDLARGPLLRARLVRREKAEHVLLLTAHHIACDGWSMGVLVRDVGALYGAASTAGTGPGRYVRREDAIPGGAEPRGIEAADPLPELPIRYGDFAAWQRRWLAGAQLEADLAWWRERLAGLPPALDLPADRPRPPVASHRGLAVASQLPAGLRHDLERQARAGGATLFMSMLAAFAALLHRSTGEGDLAIGTPVAGRDRLETEGLVGLFVNTLVLRLRPRPGQALGELTTQAREATLGAHAHQSVPFERLVEALAPERSLGRTPLFQVMLVFQNAPLPSLSLPDLEVTPLQVEGETAKVDLTLYVTEAGGGALGLTWVASRDLFHAATVRRLARHFEALLAAAAEGDGRPLAELPLFTAAERQQLLTEANDFARPATATMVLAQFEERARRHPEAPALRFEEQVLSYGELDAAAEGLAGRLTELGVGPEVPVALLLERGPSFIVALLAAWKAGGAYLPLDPGLPARRLATLLEESASPVLVSSRRLAGRLGESEPAALAGRALCLEEEWPRDGGAPGASAAPRPEDLAYVLFTSGSTGLPKGVAVEHRQLATYVAGATLRLGLPDDARGLVFATVSTFAADLGHTVVFPALALGGCLHVVSEERLADGDALAELFSRHPADVLKIVPSHLAALVAAPGAERLLPRRLLVLGGEALERGFAEELARRAPGCEVFNHYGPTETTVGVLAGRSEPTLIGSGVVPLGRPLANVQVHVVDRALRPVGLGTPGELLIAGASVARGYLGRPAATAERFLPDPFAAESVVTGGGRLYRSGDRVRRLPGGEIEFLGRIDLQVKLRGFRIELPEIEAALAALPAVRAAAVTLREDAPGGRALAAYVVPAEAVPGASFVHELRRALGERLPVYMVPAVFVVLPALPLNPNGKVDRRALPAPDWGAESGAGGSEPPRTPVEEALAAIWAELLGGKRVGREDDFFALGGHSLLATRLASRVRAAFDIELPLSAVFERPTLAGLAAAVEEARARAGAARPGPLTLALSPQAGRGDRTGDPGWVGAPSPRASGERDGVRGAAAPLSFSQERLWFLSRLDPRDAAYNLPYHARLSGPLDDDALTAALAGVVDRHEVLRASFREAGGEPMQEVAPVLPVRLPVVDLSAVAALDPAGEPAPLARRLAESEAARPFDLSRAPLWRGRLLRLAPGEHLLLLTLHHAVSDAWSRSILVRELAALYDARVTGREAQLPELALQYGDYARWQRRRLASGELAGELEDWRQALAGSPALDLPTDRPRAPARRRRGGHRAALWAAAPVAAVAALARRHGTTPFAVYLAAFGALLARLSGQREVNVGTPVAGRTRLEHEGLIGFLVNTLALRLAVPPQASFGELVADAGRGALAAFERQEVPFERVVEAVAPERDLDRTPLFQAMLVLQNGGGEEALSLGGLEWRRFEVGTGTAKFDLTLALEERPTGLAVWLEFDADLFDPTTAERWLRHWQRLLEGAVAAAGAPLAALPLISPAEQHQVRVETNEAEHALSRSHAAGCLHDGFERQTGRVPEAVALVWGDERFSYAAVERASTAWARRLQSWGIQPEDRVGLYLERSPELLIALLAVLRAGGAYVPLDPAYPLARVRALVEQSGARWVLSGGGLEERLEGLPCEVVRVGGEELAAPAQILRCAQDDEHPRCHPERSEGPGWGGSPVTPQNLAYLIFTSGSTGVPKAVAIEHASAVALLAWAETVYSDDEISHVLAATSISFDLSIFEIFVPWSRGTTVVLAGTALDLLSLPGREAVTLINTVPSAMAELARAGGVPQSVRTVNLGGEPLRRSLAGEVYAAASVERLYNLYGPSEDTTYSTWLLVEPGTAEPTIGRALAGSRAFVVDRRGRPLPLGVPGELLLGGAGLARGYLGRPALTAERFLPDGISGQAGERLYATGDLARWLTSHELEFLGRIDHQVKVRGYRIELAEIEAALLAQPEVRETVVAVHEAGGGDRRIAAYLTPREGEALPEAAELRSRLAERLPGYMVPASFVELAALPRLPNGKIDRKALPAPETGTGEGDLAAWVGPRTPLEETLSELAREMLGTSRLGIHESFFEAGGHSLSAVRLLSRVRESLGAEVGVRAFFEAPTVAGLAQAIQASTATALPPIERAASRGEGPLSFAQERLWFLDRLEPGTAAYNIPAAVRMRGALHLGTLSRALAALAERHESLRTVFTERDGRPVQVVLDGSTLHPNPLPASGARGPEGGTRTGGTARASQLAASGDGGSEDVLSGPLAPRQRGEGRGEGRWTNHFRPRLVDLGALSPQDRETLALSLAAREARRPFELARGPLVRALLVQSAETDHLLVLTLHHIVTDGWSMGLLVRELGTLYQAFHDGRPSPLAPLPVQHLDYAFWQRRHLEGAALENGLAYWREHLAGLPAALDLPTDRPRAAARGGRGGRRRVVLVDELSAALRALGRGRGATLFMTLAASFQALLARLSGQNDLAVGVPVAGRGQARLEGIVGFFVNTLVLRADLGGGPSFAGLLSRVRDSALGAFTHADTPFERVVEAVAPDRDLDRTPLFQALFNFQEGETAPSLGGLTLESVDLDAGTAKFELSLAVVPRGERLEAVLEFDADLFDATTAERWLRHWQRLLEGVVEAPEAPLVALPLSSPAEQHQVRVEANEAEHALSRRRSAGCLHESFERQAERVPEAVALVWGDERFSYAAVERASAAWAARLQGWGIEPEDRVGLYMERSPELLIALLAVLRAGGAYVPLDPAYPLARVRALVEQSGARWVLSGGGLEERLEGLPCEVVRVGGEELAAPAQILRCAQDDKHPRCHPERSEGPGRAGSPRHPPEPGLPHLHLGLDRGAQGRRHRARERRGPPRLGGDRLLRRRDLPRARRHLDLLRSLGLRDLRALEPRHDRGARRHRARSPQPAGPGRGHAPQHRALGHDRAGAGRRRAALGEDRQPGGRAPAPLAGGRGLRRGVCGAPLQPLRPLRGHHLLDRRAGRERKHLRADHRPRPRRQPRFRGGPPRPAPAAGSARRAAPGRCGPRPRLPRPPGAHRRALCAGRHLRQGWRAALQNR